MTTVPPNAMIWRTADMSVLAYLIPSVFTEMASATGFYYNKAQSVEHIASGCDPVKHRENDDRLVSVRISGKSHTGKNIITTIGIIFIF